ncbi:CRISPR-associated endonuclease Cas2 [Candidatus Nomurabacteria bacterium RIFCSPHIGHO2_02_FULL_42_19]|uniref:CRISPR-associated endonuclease Cas2 n=1 Tax=Candidatus Nomurabacteria bacterium RIFCSPHIGHO2_02_FULL_42_19 TaxID=1801756 RepID=A0A1F6W391_9BACT|nr:MAG: CRISPR-associated endonuclease Cas2 [Candidatus Nomurabacteria bacterium RIFCSPHIGHO2_02_FULL_42_19]
MKGQILLKALETIKDSALSQVDFFEAVLRSGYGAGMGKINYEYTKIQRAREGKLWHERNREERKKRLQNFLYQMKHDGLIEEAENKNLIISELGRQKIKELKSRLPDRHYKIKSIDEVVIISFDIPEKLRHKRNWFREVVKNLGFQMVHQSVWMGKKKISHKLIDDLEELKILEYIEIFKVTKSGSLKKLT